MHPPRMSAPSCIVPPTEQLVIRPHIVPLLPTFHGMESENPYAHIKEFEDDKAKVWLNSLRPRSIRSWTDLQAEFSRNFSRLIGQWLEKANLKLLTKRMRNSMNVGRYTWKLSMLVLTMALIHGYCTWWRSVLLPAVREMFGDQANVIGQFKPNNNASYGNTYNSNWRNHPNFSWKPRAPQYTQPGQAPPQASNLEQAIVNLSKSKNQRVKQRKKREEIKGKRKWNNTKNEDLEANVNEKSERTVNQEEMIKKHMPPPFPQALHGKKGINNTSEILEVLRQVKVNIPLLDMIKECKSPVKYKDLQLGLGELKPTSITLSLADRSVKIPRGMIEDVLIQVDKFYYPVDFVVLDTDLVAKGTNCIPIILGRPFLATSNAIINCRNGVMQLTFGNMTLELNIFYMCNKQFHPGEEEGPEEVCMIDNLVEEHCDQKMLEDLNEVLGILMKGYLNP
ncbi:hypothetical protein CK203_040297 [Vitis vinifera]|uniref:Retrotransposon gag domain-containing protein n=1 Tax=Vitis vinifera TaxID=29760 RepID=A0A438HXH0_VITVI|nr:hypothetical protein CK203_040297 [Vitis vinifera]